MVQLGHARLDENGKTKNGKAGDQNGNEVMISKWYSRPWSYVLRPKSKNVAERSAKACEDGCENQFIGYCQGSRNGAYIEAQKVGFDLSKIKTPCNTDCSAFMTLCAIAGGVESLKYTGNAPTTSSMKNVFLSTGQYDILTDSSYINTDVNLKRGDILVSPGHHTAMALNDGENVTKANSQPLSYPARGIDMSVYQDPTRINYQSLKAIGVKTVVLKAIGKNNSVDHAFEEHYKRLTNLGIPVSVYGYTYARTPDEAAIEAKAMIGLLDGRQINTVYLDVEDKSLPVGEQLIHNINTYISLVQGAGYRVAIYTYDSFFKDRLMKYKNMMLCRQIWLARYPAEYNGISFNVEINDKYRPRYDGFSIVGFQYTSSGSAPSMYNGKLDFDIFYSAVCKNRFLAKTGAIKTIKVTANTLRVRNQPIDGEVMEYVGKGTKLFVYEQDKQTGWYRVGNGLWVGTQYVVDC